MRQDNRGITLIELIIAITISTIIMGAVTIFIGSALKSYNMATAAVDLQMESHVLIEQLSSWAMEGSNVVITDENMLVIYNIPRNTDVGRLPAGTVIAPDGRIIASAVTPDPDAARAKKRVIWMNGTTGKLYMAIVDGIGNPETDTTVRADYAGYENNGHCISEFLAEFNPKWDNNKKALTLDMKLKSGTNEYAVHDVISMRNSSPAASSSPAPSPSTGS